LLSFSAETFVFHVAIQNYKDKYMQNYPSVLCGCETWSLTLWDEGRLRESENRVGLRWMR